MSKMHAPALCWFHLSTTIELAYQEVTKFIVEDYGVHRHSLRTYTHHGDGCMYWIYIPHGDVDIQVMVIPPVVGQYVMVMVCIPTVGYTEQMYNHLEVMIIRLCRYRHIPRMFVVPSRVDDPIRSWKDRISTTLMRFSS